MLTTYPSRLFPSRSLPFRLLAIAFVLCACRLAHAGMFGHSQPIPQWGLDAYKTHTPDYAKDAAAVILYDEYLETVDAQGRAVERERYAMRVLKPQGRSEVTCAVSYGEDEKINS